MNADKIYFKGLNAMRFFAALAVLLAHVELIKHHIGVKAHLWIDTSKNISDLPIKKILSGEQNFLSPLLSEMGTYGVVFFFVLSGFLITYLLLAEKEKTNTIRIRKFYLRRIFRIWPLYFLIILLGFYILPYIELFDVGKQSESLTNYFGPNLFLYCFLLPHLAMSIYPHIPNIGQSWSIGVEEQFYLFWPFLFKYFSKPLRIVSVFLILFILIKALFRLNYFSLDPDYFEVIKNFLAATKIECMAIGAIGAIILKNHQNIIQKYFLSNGILILSGVAILSSFYIVHPIFQDGLHIINSFFFLCLILNISLYDNSIVKLEHKLFSILGKISYGIYMFHMMFCSLVINLIIKFKGNKDFNFIDQILLYVSVIGLTLITAWLSYRYLEKPFLRFKNRHQIVKSSS